MSLLYSVNTFLGEEGVCWGFAVFLKKKIKRKTMNFY